MERITIQARELELSAVYAPVKEPRAAVQLIHGMTEHKGRHLELVRFLNDKGYTAIISDNRGHGASINDKYRHGFTGSPEDLVADQYEVTKYIKAKAPGLPLYMFGHSMGSLIARQYIMTHDDEIEKLVLCGTVAYNPAAWLGVALARCMKKDGCSPLLLALSNNCSFKQDKSWLSYNEENIKEFQNDPLSRFRFRNYSNQTLFTMVRDLSKTKLYQYKNPNLKIMSVSGRDDRTTGGTERLEETLGYLKKVGYEVGYKEYDHMKHEILKEQDRQTVMEDIAAFFG